MRVRFARHSSEEVSTWAEIGTPIGLWSRTRAHRGGLGIYARSGKGRVLTRVPREGSGTCTKSGTERVRTPDETRNKAPTGVKSPANYRPSICQGSGIGTY